MFRGKEWSARVRFDKREIPGRYKSPIRDPKKRAGTGRNESWRFFQSNAKAATDFSSGPDRRFATHHLELAKME